MCRGGPPRHIGDALPPEAAAAADLARARQFHGAPPPAPPPDRPPERSEPPANSPEDAGFPPAEPPETALERFETLAEEFRRDTGMLAPGKDYPVGAHPPPDAERADRWAAWLKDRRRAAAARAAELARAAQPAPASATSHGHKPKPCSSCPGRILWAQVLELDEELTSPTRGQWIRAKKDDGRLRAIPVDFDPRPDGNVVLQHWRGEDGKPAGIVARVFKDAEAARRVFPTAPLRTSHFATCPNANRHRKKGRGRR